MKLEEHEIRRYIGAGEVIRVDRGSGGIQVHPKNCSCVILAAILGRAATTFIREGPR